ncbi:hypothetical protein BX286_6312 [Streptomyces sp. 3211.6]|uniref:hypothetical protein n=1 Tax=Streptomyces sp. 3211.6 TaxID=1938845 RepID=UPI000EB1422B|nr:hypothetical protein [Streptomyces sp. 3211.6]RKT08228.1 hypothetical protein BX286_6312 [Streptomyces sp. 3211.6]
MIELTSLVLALSPTVGTACVAGAILGRVRRRAATRGRNEAYAEAAQRLAARDEEALHTAPVRLLAMAAGPRPVTESSAGTLLHPQLAGTAFAETQRVVLRQVAALLNAAEQPIHATATPATKGGTL